MDFERLVQIERQTQAVRATAGLRRGRFEVTNQAPDADAEMWLYDEIGSEGITARAFAAALAQLGGRDFLLRINSPGGSAFDGLAMYHALRQYPGSVDVQVDGLAASAASVAMVGGDHIAAAPGAQLLIHDAHGTVYGTADDMAFMAGALDSTSQAIAAAYADRAGGTKAEWRDRMVDNGTWFSADEALGAGLVDQVLQFSPRYQPVGVQVAAGLHRAMIEVGQERQEIAAVATEAARANITAIMRGIASGIVRGTRAALGPPPVRRGLRPTFGYFPQG